MTKEELKKKCSGCLQLDRTVNRLMFDGLCADCTTRAIDDINFTKKAKEENVKITKLLLQ